MHGSPCSGPQKKISFSSIFFGDEAPPPFFFRVWLGVSGHFALATLLNASMILSQHWMLEGISSHAFYEQEPFVAIESDLCECVLKPCIFRITPQKKCLVSQGLHVLPTLTQTIECELEGRLRLHVELSLTQRTSFWCMTFPSQCKAFHALTQI